MEPRIGLFGLFGSGNFGNDGSLEAMIRQLRATVPAAQLLAICDGPDVVKARYGIDAARMAPAFTHQVHSKTAKIAETLIVACRTAYDGLRTARQLDCIVMPGTGLLDDFNSSPRGIPLTLWLWCAAARLVDTPVHFVSIGAGPIVNPWSRRLMIACARLAASRSYRDQGSKAFLAGLGVDTHADPVYPDLAFALPLPRTIPADSQGNGPIVGLGLMTYRGWRNNAPDSDDLFERYLSKLGTFARGLLSSGYRIRVIIGDDCDRETVPRFIAGLKAAGSAAVQDQVIVEAAETLQDVMRQMGSCDVIVASRFHNIVCALKAGRPVVSVGYAEKNRLLLEKAGLGSFAVEIDSFTAPMLRKQFDEAFAGKNAIESRLKAFDSQSLALLQQQAVHLSALIQSQKPHAHLLRPAFRTPLAGVEPEQART